MTIAHGVVRILPFTLRVDFDCMPLSSLNTLLVAYVESSLPKESKESGVREQPILQLMGRDLNECEAGRT